MGRIFGRTPKEPDMDGRTGRERAADSIRSEARSDGRNTQEEGFAVGGQHRGHRDGRGSGGDEVERSGGSDWARRR